jgi:hypothetical protein
VPKDINRHRPIYHYRYALEALFGEGNLYPRRLFTVMFPLHQVSVRGYERRAEDYEELEWFFMRAIGHAHIDKVTALREFYGLDEKLVRYIVDVLKAIGHLSEAADGCLTLTSLGQESLADERRYENYESHQVLYFDGFICYPLPGTHYALDFFTPSDLTEEDKALYSFRSWQREVLDELAKNPEKAKYNVPDEIRSFSDPLHVGLAYLPMHIAEAILHPQGQTLRVFTNIRGHRDKFFEILFEHDPQILTPLLDDRRSPQEVIRRGLEEGRGLVKGSYHLETTPTGDWRVKVPRSWLTRQRSDGALYLIDLGEYLLAADYCVRVWSDNVDLRYEAGCLKALNKLEYLRGNLSPARVWLYVENIFTQLEVPVAEVSSLLNMAQERSMSRALDRLENLLGLSNTP